MAIAFKVLNRWTGSVQFTAQIECAEDTPTWLKVGLAVKWAFGRGADLRGADLRGAVLRGAVLRGAVLRGADLSDADLRDADLSGAVLSGAVLSDADLRDAVLSDADLRGAVLRGAVLRGADLSGADLSGADLSGADLRGADVVFAGIDARGYEFYLTADKAAKSIIIRAGCRRWTSFAEARAHYGAYYASDGVVPEIMAKLAMLEAVARHRGYLPD